ncbi:MAG: hypothetical protein JSV51_02485 [Candidatus Bathyarchaeota archaeon]|nr:MAG: hypothetical protein JSV51_02485 [Candidatus Bathyarchaeota archaeon]
MSAKALKCPSCGAPLDSTDVEKCEYCKSTLVYSVPKHTFKIAGEEGVFRGIARNVEQRLENGYTVLSFRIEQIDNEGNITGYVQVELRDPRIKGTLVEGDDVEVVGKIGKDGLLIPNKILNLKTKAYISKSSSNIGIFLFFVPFITAIGGFIASRWTMEGAIMGFIGGLIPTVLIFFILAATRR